MVQPACVLDYNRGASETSSAACCSDTFEAGSMSWLFGWWKGSGSPPAEEQTPAAPAEGGGRAPGGSGGDKQVDKWSNFDPTGLERAARAARELDKSRAYFLFTLLSFISPQFNQNPCFI